MPEPVDPRHLLLIGAGPGVGASVVRRFGREGSRSTLISHSETLERLAPKLRGDGLVPWCDRVQRRRAGSWRDPRHDRRAAADRI
jgi:NAD(P)-dependent dehydrogenase (short-subunit alcohol dehydrogenase family)